MFGIIPLKTLAQYQRIINQCIINQCLINQCIINQCISNQCIINQCIINQCIINQCIINQCIINWCIINQCIINQCISINALLVHSYISAYHLNYEVFCLNLPLLFLQAFGKRVFSPSYVQSSGLDTQITRHSDSVEGDPVALRQ